MSTSLNEKCACGATISIEDDSAKEATRALDKWLSRHEAHDNPVPKVTGTGSSAERGTRTDAGFEMNDGWGTRVPIISAQAVPFGFVRNEENR